MSEVTLRVESNERAPSASRSHLDSLRLELEPRFDDVVLLVSELVTNSVRHSESSDIAISVIANNGKVRVEVTDDGPGFNTGDPRGDGMGLEIVEKLADRWGLKNENGFTVWAEMTQG